MYFKKSIINAVVVALSVGATQSVMAAFDDSGTDYESKQTNVRIWTPGTDPLETVNSILCYVDQFNANEMVGKGFYTALIDEKLCLASSADNDRDNSPSQIKVVVHSSRVDNNSAQITKFWVPMGSEEIKGTMSISKAPTAADPYQDFTMHYTKYDNDDNGTIIGQGQIVASPSSQLSDGKIGIEFYEYMGENESFEFAASILKNPDGSIGDAITYVKESPTAKSVYGLSWNDTVVEDRVRVLSLSGSNAGDITNNADFNIYNPNEVCLAKNTINTSIYRYGLYYKNDETIGNTTYSAGQEVEINSGFPFTYEVNGEEKQGYVGYWGMWTETDDELPDTISQVDYSYDTPVKTQVTITDVPGKLWKKQKQRYTLENLEGVEFEYSNTDGQQRILESTVDDNGLVEWYETASITYDENGRTVNPLPNNVLVNPSSPLYLWSVQLGGEVKIPNGLTNRDDPAYVTTRAMVTPEDALFNGNDAAVSLFCEENCISDNITTQKMQDSGPFLSESTAYTISRTDMTLKLDGGAAAGYSGVNSSDLLSTSFPYGVTSGALVANESDFSLISDGTLLTWYEWETGVESWNKSTIVRKSSDSSFITFEAPKALKLNYSNTNSLVDPANPDYDSQDFFLEYGGNGNLSGIPYAKVGSSDRYGPVIALKDGAVLTEVTTNQNPIEYVVKAWSIEKQFSVANNNDCSRLILNNLPNDLPNRIDNSLATNTETIPSESELPAVPSVVNGVVVSQD